MFVVIVTFCVVRVEVASIASLVLLFHHYHSMSVHVVALLSLCSGYNPADFAHLNVTDDVRDLFQYIGRYKPHNIALDCRMKCFVPDYIPAVGEIDAFLKVRVSCCDCETRW